MIRKKRIKDLPSSERPREKLLLKGNENMTDAELLALLLSTGTKKHNALSLGKLILQRFNVHQLTTISSKQLEKIQGVGRGKAARIIAAIELGKRIFVTPSITKIVITSTEEALQQVKHIAEKKQEHIIVLYLNARNELIQKETIAVGSLNFLVIEPKEIFSPAVISPCASVIIAHNHPSGDPQPSEEDIQFTRRIQKAGELLGIPLTDHLIISSTGYFSFRGI